MGADSTEIRREQAETLANRIIRDSFEQGRPARIFLHSGSARSHWKFRYDRGRRPGRRLGDGSITRRSHGLPLSRASCGWEQRQRARRVTPCSKKRLHMPGAAGPFPGATRRRKEIAQGGPNTAAACAGARLGTPNRFVLDFAKWRRSECREILAVQRAGFSSSNATRRSGTMWTALHRYA